MLNGTEFINYRDFNQKFKNILRDIYVYQFKNKSIDFYVRGSFAHARMVAVIIACTVDKKIAMEDLLKVRMEDIDLSKNSVSICVPGGTSGMADEKKQTLLLEKPLSEMFRYLYTVERKAYFVTGNIAPFSKAGMKKLAEEQETFKKRCVSPRTVEKMYHYWGEVYLREANETIASSTYRNDSMRLQAVIGEMAKVHWSYGSKINHINNCLEEDSDSCVECVTTDTRTLTENPFHTLYRYCNRYQKSGKEFFNIVFSVLLYFGLNEKTERREVVQITPRRWSSFDEFLKGRAAFLFNSKNGRGDRGDGKLQLKSWEALTPKQKSRYAAKIPAYFMNSSLEAFRGRVCEKVETKYGTYGWNDLKDYPEARDIISRTMNRLESSFSDEFLDVFMYLVKNKKNIAYNGQNFEAVNAEHVEKQVLHLAVFDFFHCGEKQFFTYLKELTKTGILREYRELILRIGQTSDNEEEKEKVEEILRSSGGRNFMLSGRNEDGFLLVHYDSDVGENTVSELKGELLSVCKECKDSDRTYFDLSKCFLKDVLGGNSDLTARFSEMVSFFSQTALLGEIGSYILDRLPAPTWPLCYKHNYIVRALNDNNNIMLLYALQNPKLEDHYWVELECRDAMNEFGYQHFVCYPIEIREDVSNGRQFLVFYDPAYRSISSVRIDFIDNVVVGECPTESYFHSDLQNAHKLIKATWGVHFSDFYEGNVKVEPHPNKVSFAVRIEATGERNGKKFSEKFIKDRIKREIGDFKEEKVDDTYSLLRMVVHVVNPLDMLHWIKTYTRRIYDVKIEYNSFMDDVERARKMYLLPHQERVSASLGRRNGKILRGRDVGFVPVESKSDVLFHEIYSDLFRDFGRALFGVSSGIAVDRRGIALAEGFVSGVGNERVPLFSFINGGCVSDIYDLIPLTDLEVQWLHNILSHPLAKAFLVKDECDAIRTKLPPADCFNIFDEKTVTLVERHAESALEDYYKSTENFPNGRLDIGTIIRETMEAVRERRLVKIKYLSQNQNILSYHAVPYCVEYSKRDNRFRIKVVALDKRCLSGVRVSTVNADGVLDMELTKESLPEDVMREEIDFYNSEDGEKKKLDVYFSECDADQILTEFSCYKKTCVRWGSGRYRMTLTYYKEDYMEIVIRLLGYGSRITVWGSEDDIVVRQLKDRYQEQSNLFEERSGQKLRFALEKMVEKEE